MKNRSWLTLFTTILSVLACFGLLPQIQAAPDVVPAPDGCYSGFTTAEGCNALQHLTNGAGNTGLGWRSLFSNTTGNYNTGVGAGALILNTADSNTAVGAAALLLNTTGGLNTAVGTDALVHNNTGDSNTAVGAFALFTNAGAGISNNAVGRGALFNNTTGSFNEAMGVNALGGNTTGSNNIAIGDDALISNVGGGGNTAVGQSALFSTTGSNNTAVGSGAGSNTSTGNSNICIGSGVTGVAGESNAIRIGENAAQVGGTNSKTFIGGIFGATIGAANAIVGVNANGQLGTAPSSARFKKDIEAMDNHSEVIFSLKPVSFHYKGDESNLPCFGLIAEDVAKVNPDLILLDNEGKPLTVRYEQINAMLLNEFLKEHRKVNAQQASIAELKSTVAQQQKGMEVLTAQLKEQAAQIQKVRARLEVSKPAPQVVTNKS
jgi:hypothetical protein